MTQLIKYGNIANLLKSELSNFDYSQCAILVDDNTTEHCLPLLEGVSGLRDALIIGIKHGESNKNLQACNYIWRKMQQGGMDRNSILINLGGGVICDIGGFCASTYLRGIDFLHIPTTLLAQVDASIGGKTGIDFASQKNAIGLIAFPTAVLIDNRFLRTLPKEELNSGLAEMVKHSLLDCMGHFKEFENLNWNESIPELDLIQESVNFKKNIVDLDPRENNLRKSLNFGHTLGHAVESYFLEKGAPMRHGEAVVIGIIAALEISAFKSKFPEAYKSRIVNFLLKNFTYRDLSEDDVGAILKWTKRDKKTVNGNINFVTLSDVGRVQIDVSVSPEELERGLEFYRNCSESISEKT